jgi:MarR family transcriptional regulator, 2-MHQ and catechol-resistance regulon repressor
MPSHYSGTAAENRTLDTFIKLTRCTSAVLARLAACNSVGELTYSQFAVMEAIYHLGPMTQGEVGAKILKSGSNITTVMDNLERDGLVQRKRDEKDRRVVYADLTAAGRKKIEAVLPGHVAALVDVFSVLSVTEHETLARLCKKLGKGKQAGA